jgi:hypothetical protein
VERRGLAVCLLALFIALTVLATVIAGSRPGLEPGLAPWILQVAGYLSALLGGVLLLTIPGPGAHRRAGLVVVGAVAVLALLEALLGENAGVNIGGGFVRLVCLVAVVAVTVRMGMAAASGGPRS